MSVLGGKRGNGHLNVTNLTINVISNVDQVEALMEQYLIFHTNFLWDKAREFIEHERDTFRAAHQSHVSSILASLMNALSQLTLADKNYLTLQFFSSKVFQRKDSVKCSYENLRQEFMRLEERGSFVGQQLPRSGSQPNTPHHQSYHPTHSSPSNFCTYQSQQHQQLNEAAQDVLDVEELFGEETQLKTASPVASPEPPATPPPKSQSFISRFFRFSKASHSNQASSVSPTPNCSGNDSLPYMGSNSDESSPSDSSLLKSEQSGSLESLDRFAAHLSGQLLHYVKVRIDMIDLYDKLSCVCPGRKFCLMDECLRTLNSIHISADRNFHHPILSRLKTMFMFECDILLSLLHVHTNIQSWKFLDSLFFLQEAHNKLNMMANIRDSNLNSLYSANSMSHGKPGSGSAISPLITSASSSALRRNVTSSSLSSSTSSSLGVPPTNGSLSGLGTGSIISAMGGNHSPSNPLTPMGNFVYPSQYTSLYGSPKLFSSNSRQLNTANMPLLIQWLNRFKLFLLSKYSFYFHSLLMVHLTPSSIASSISASTGTSSSTHSSSANYAHIESQMRQLCSKHLYDFHSRIVQFVRKFDSSYVILIFEPNAKMDFSTSGYRSPYLKKELPKGINSFPIIYSFPGEFPKNRIPSLIMIMTDRFKDLNSSEGVVVEHDKPNSDEQLTSGAQTSASSTTARQLNSNQHQYGSNNNSSGNPLPNATYFLIRPDPDFTLAMICEQKKAERDSHIVAFLQELTILLKGTKIFTSLRNGSLK